MPSTNTIKQRIKGLKEHRDRLNKSRAPDRLWIEQINKSIMIYRIHLVLETIKQIFKRRN
jgi:DNA replication initiation complex subunit (GINS family)